MTDQSRVEAVARAIDPLAWDELDKLDEAIIPSERLLSRIKASKQTANRAIEANDAWLQGLGAFKAIYTCTSCGDAFEMTMATVQPCIQCKDGSRLLSIQEIKR